MPDQKIRLGGLWCKSGKNGTDYLTGKLGMARLLIFSNDEKLNEQSPDFTIYLVSDDREPESPRAPQANQSMF